MREPSHADAYQVLLLQASASGRGDVLFGESLPRARQAALPFFLEGDFPSVYLEYPLAGAPFLDVTILYDALDAGARIDSPLADGTEAALEWYRKAREKHEQISFGFELDTKDPKLPRAAVHFQPRKDTQLVMPFCEAVGEPERGRLYLDLAARMPKGWELSFFGMFRGRPGSPLRVCGYLDGNERKACVQDPDHLAHVFKTIGFGAYDDAMLEQITMLMAAVTEGMDFQLDVYPDGTLGTVFALDNQFGIQQPAAVRDCFQNGGGAQVMQTLQHWGVADDRWRLTAEASFATYLPCQREDNTWGKYAFTLMPQWVKTRWANCTMQPAKVYYLGKAGFLT